jgi:autophagy-related protein 17
LLPFQNYVPEERVVRESFNAEHGAHLPSDLCLYIENPPTRWQVIPLDGDAVESIPDVDNALLEEVELN